MQTFPSLSKQVLAQRGEKVWTFQPGIAHIGVGNFHRAHQALYTQQAIIQQHGPWGIVGIGIKQWDVKMNQILTSQDCLYTLVQKYPDGKISHQIIQSLVHHIDGYTHPQSAITALSEDSIKIISMTITEGGYNLDPKTGEFSWADKQIQVDLENVREGKDPISVFGFLAMAFMKRMKEGRKGVTVLSCDNVQHNGEVAKKAFLSFFKSVDESLFKWCNQNCSFPNSMVDRITPKTSSQEVTEVQAIIKCVDNWPVCCQDFRQWVIEEKFVRGRPAWHLCQGVLVVEDVAPYEKMKLRLLNAGHQAIAYLGMLKGYTYVHQACQDPQILSFGRQYLLQQSLQTIEVKDIDLQNYVESVFKRFSNRYVKDTLARICQFASDRIATFNLPAVFQMVEKTPTRQFLKTVQLLAYWRRWVQLFPELVITDPLKQRLLNSQPQNFITQFTDIFKTLSQNKLFLQDFITSYNNVKLTYPCKR